MPDTAVRYMKTLLLADVDTEASPSSKTLGRLRDTEDTGFRGLGFRDYEHCVDPLAH